MRPFAVSMLFIPATLALAIGIIAAPQPQQPPLPTPQTPSVTKADPTPAKDVGRKHRRHRGAKSSRAHWLALQATKDPAVCHTVRAVVLPAQYGIVPTQLSMWGNSIFGNCVTAEGAFAIAAASVAAGQPEIFVPENNAVSWARSHGDLNGADLVTVMQQMARSGLTDASGKAWPDGPYSSVDYTDYTTVCDAIYTTGPVKLGVASGQFDSFADVGEKNGWVMTGLRPDSNEDHCVSLCGFGTMQLLCTMMGVGVPSGANPTAPSYLMFTWSTIGVIDAQSMVNISAEAYVRNPTTVGIPLPNPTPSPAPTPTPTPTPTPSPDPPGFTGTFQTGGTPRRTVTVKDGLIISVEGKGGIPAGFNGSLMLNFTDGVLQEFPVTEANVSLPVKP